MIEILGIFKKQQKKLSILYKIFEINTIHIIKMNIYKTLYKFKCNAENTKNDYIQKNQTKIFKKIDKNKLVSLIYFPWLRNGKVQTTQFLGKFDQ